MDDRNKSFSAEMSADNDQNATTTFWQSFLTQDQSTKSAADQQAELYIDGFMSLGHEEEDEEEEDMDRSLHVENVPVLHHVQQQQQVLRQSLNMKDFLERDRIHPTPRKSHSDMELEENLRQKPVPERFALNDFMSEDSSAYPIHRRSIDTNSNDGDGFDSNDHQEMIETPSRSGSSRSNNDMMENQQPLYHSVVRASLTADSGNNSPGKEFLEKLIQFEEKNKADGGGDSFDLLGTLPCSNSFLILAYVY